MKKFGLLLSIFVCAITLFGCETGVVKKVEKNMSELTKTYFFGECDEFCCSLSSGEREKEYLLNGFSTESVPFSLLTLKFFEEKDLRIVKVKLSIDEEASEVELELNPINGQFMVDLEREMRGNETLAVEFDEKKCELENLSKDFEVNWKEAIKIGADLFEKQILANQSFGTLGAEMYLRVVDKKANDCDDAFWSFTVLDLNGKSWSAIISTVDGKILSFTK